MSLPAGSRNHAKTLALPETKKASTVKPAAACGQSVPVYLGTFDPITQSLKTSQLSLVETTGDGFSEFSSTFPRSGTMRNGTVYQLANLARTTTEIGSGLLPTPRSMEVVEHPMKQAARLKDRTGLKPNNLQSMAKFNLWPTPTASSSQSASMEASLKEAARLHPKGQNHLAAEVAWREFYPTLMWPTPAATDYKGAGKKGQLRDRLDYATERGGTKSKTYPMPESSGQLNPMWVEWLMGYPIGHTALKD